MVSQYANRDSRWTSMPGERGPAPSNRHRDTHRLRGGAHVSGRGERR